METQIGFKFIDHLAGQGQEPQAQTQTPANSNAPVSPTANSSPADEAVGSRPARYRGANYSSNSPTNLFFSTASEPLLQPPAGAPKTFKEYSTQWDAWKNEAHPIDENRSEAVRRMENFLMREIAEWKVEAFAGSYGLLRPFVPEVPPNTAFYSNIDLSSLGLSSLPPWLPKARKVNLDNNKLQSFPAHLITHLTDRRDNLVIQPEIRLANNQISTIELNKLQSMIDSPDYQGPKLVLPREGQRYEPPQEVVPG